MRSIGYLCLTFVVVSVCGWAVADLQNVEVGGSLEIFFGWYNEFYEVEDALSHFPVPVPHRPIGPTGFFSPARADGHGHGYRFVEQRTRLHLKADLTDYVTAFIELDSVELWGEDFRSNYLLGTDFRADSSDDVEVFQGYVEADQMWGLPLRLRVGRQEMAFGSGWLVGTNPGSNPLTGLSFDAARATLTQGDFVFDAWLSKLNERSPLEEDGDTDFYGLYASYRGLEGMELDAYWMYLRDGMEVRDTQRGLVGDWLEHAFGRDDYDVSEIHTVGLRFAGERGPWYWEAEGAYQFGNAGTLGQAFVPVNGIFGDDDASYGEWGAHFELDYTIDTRFSPVVYVGAEYYGGEDERELTFWEWLNPFRRTEASVSFNRLFTDYEFDMWLDESGLSNYWNAVAGVQLGLTEKLEIEPYVCYMRAVEGFARPAALRFGRRLAPLAPQLAFWSCEGSKDIGWQAGIMAAYAYSDNLSFELGYAHFFAGNGVRDGVFVYDYGMGLLGGLDDEDADHAYFQATLSF